MDEASFEKRLREYLSTPGVQSIAVALKRHGPCTLRELTSASGFSQEFTAKTRDAMASWGLVRVDWANKRAQLISLTSHGEKFVALVFKQVELLSEERTAKDGTAQSR